MKIVVTGDSHTIALKRGLDMLIDREGMPLNHQIDIKQLGPGGGFVTPFFIDRGDFAEITNEKYLRRIKQLPFSTDQGRYEYYGICGPLYSNRIWAKKNCWQEYTPFINQGDHAPISTSLLRHVVLQEQRYTMQLIELLQRLNVKVFVIEAPKPFRHHAIMEVVDPSTIAYIDSFYRKVMQDCLMAKNVPVVNIPNDCYDSDGFMLEKFRHENPADPHHANNEFGAIMIKEIIKFLKPEN